MSEETAKGRIAESALRCLDRALAAMNHAVELTRDHGPAVGMETVADFLNDTDGIDEAVAGTTPEDWLTRWQVTRAALSAPLAGLSPLLDQLDEARAKGTPGPWQVVVSGGTDLFTGESYREVEIDFNDPIENAGLVIGEHELAEADAALIVAAVNALPQLTAAIRAVEALHVPSHSYCVVCDVERDVEVVGNNPRCEHRTSFCRACEIAWPCPTVRTLTAALTPGADTAGATA